MTDNELKGFLDDAQRVIQQIDQLTSFDKQIAAAAIAASDDLQDMDNLDMFEGGDFLSLRTLFELLNRYAAFLETRP